MNLGALYRDGKSIPLIAQETGMSRSTVRRRLLGLGVQLRSSLDGTRLAGDRLGCGMRGKKRPPFSAEHRRRISEGRLRWAEENAKGIDVKKGYLRFTRGPHIHRYVHTVVAEQGLGRRLHPGEQVHHLDEDKQNNAPENLLVMSASAHRRLHLAKRGKAEQK